MTRTAQTAWVPLAAIAALAVLMQTNIPGFAQGLDNKEAVDTIIGTPVEEGQARAADRPDKIVAAIENTPRAIEAVRKASNVEKVEIVFLPDAADKAEPAGVHEAAERHAADIALLRQEIEGNAMLFHAIDSRQVMVRDVLAVDFEDGPGVIIYAAAKPPG